MSTETTLQQLKASIDTRINNLLCETRPGHDDSVVGINEAWDVVRKAFDEYIARSAAAGAVDPDRRCDSNLVDAGGNCIACNAIQGEACHAPAAAAAMTPTIAELDAQLRETKRPPLDFFEEEIARLRGRDD